MENLSFEANSNAKVRYGFLGLPWDQGDCMGWPGARLGPDAVRKWVALRTTNIVNNKLLDCEEWEILDTSDMLIKDFGNNEDFKYFDWDYSMDSFANSVKAIALQGYTPVIVGGDCSLNFPIVKGFHDAVDDYVGIIYFDAHLDVWDDFSVVGRLSHASPLLNIAGLERVRGENIVHFGARGYRTKQAIENFTFMNKTGMKIITYSQFRKAGIEKTIADILAVVKNGTGKVAMCIDIDVLNQAIAPGSSCAEPSGPDAYEIHELVKELAPHVDCFDISEVNPYADHNEHTAMVAARMYMDYMVNNYKSK